MIKQPINKGEQKENHHGLSRWPTYPSGSGYVVSRDVAAFLGGVDLVGLPDYEFEDRATGLLLAGFAGRTATPAFGGLALRDGSPQFRPWGHCTPEALVLHYQSHDKLLRRRYQRVVAGASDMCGEGFPESQVCVAAEWGQRGTFRCPRAGQAFRAVVFASYGRVNLHIGPRYPWCKEGPSAHDPDEDVCVVDSSSVRRVLAAACVGRSACTVAANPATFGALACANSALGWERPHLVATLECAAVVEPGAG